MRTIKLSKVIIKNFRSFSNEDFTFPEQEGLLLLTGSNLIEPRLGANGAGKSSFFKAVEWNTHGIGRISALMTWGSSKMSVVTHWLINGALHIITRSGPPMKVELDGNPTTQETIDKLLGLDKIRFSNAIVFGQSAPLFPDLSIGERGELLDQVLTLNIWQLAADKASEKCNTLEIELQEKKVKLSFIKGKLNATLTDAFIQEEIDRWNKGQEEAISVLTKAKSEWDKAKVKSLASNAVESVKWREATEVNIIVLRKDEESWKSGVVGKAESQIHEIYSLEAHLGALTLETESDEIGSPKLIVLLEKQLVFEINEANALQDKFRKAMFELKSCSLAGQIWQRDICPTCNQVISKEKKEHELACIQQLTDMLQNSKVEFEKTLNVALEKKVATEEKLLELRLSATREHEILRTKKKEIEKVKEQIASLEIEASKLVKQIDEPNPYTSQIAYLQKQVNPYVQQRADVELAVNPHIKQIETVLEGKNPYELQLIQVREVRKQLTEELTETQNEYNKIEASAVSAQYWKQGFKRIRLYFIQQVLAALQIEIQAAINSLGLDGWKIVLSTETVTKSETIKLGVQINIFSPISEGEWTSWSGGEAQRLKRAIAIGLSSLIQRAAGVSYNLEVFDEPTAGLSPEGIEDLLEALQYRSESLNKQIWVVDHSALTYAGFSEIFCAVKDSTGSKLVRVMESS